VAKVPIERHFILAQETKAYFQVNFMFQLANYKAYEKYINTLWTGDADLRLYITTVQDG